MKNIPTPLDVRGLSCPEPFRKATEQAMALDPGESFELLISVEPQPLFGHLKKNGFLIDSHSTANGDFLVEITATGQHIDNRDKILVDIPSCHQVNSTA